MMLKKHTVKNKLPFFIVLKNGVIAFVAFESKKGYIGFPKLIPSKNTNRNIVLINNVKYRRDIGYDKWFKKKYQILSEYLEYSSQFGTKVFCFPKEDIRSYIYPLEYKFKQERLLDQLVLSLSIDLKIPRNSIGIEGSFLLGYQSSMSDIDILIYGKQNARNLCKNFEQLSNNPNFIIFNKEMSEEIYKRRKNIGYGETFKSVVVQDLRRFYGYFKNRRFSIVAVPGENEELDRNRKISYIGDVSIVLKITNSEGGCLVPSVYYGEDYYGNSWKVEIISHYGINQARVGELFYVKGCVYHNKEDQEKIISIAFWNNIISNFSLLKNAE